MKEKEELNRKKETQDEEIDITPTQYYLETWKMYRDQARREEELREKEKQEKEKSIL